MSSPEDRSRAFQMNFEDAHPPTQEGWVWITFIGMLWLASLAIYIRSKRKN